MQRLNPIVPFQFYPDRHEAMLAAMRELNSRFGICRFLLVGPGLGVRLTGFPRREVYQQIGELILRVKDALAPLGAEVGWWCSPTLKSGRSSFQNIVGLDGRAAAISSCPLDATFREALSGGMAAAAAVARPFMLLLEDDFQLSFHPGADFGCFCPLHLAEFAKRMGRAYQREQLADIFRTCTPENQQLRQAWSLVSRDSLVQLAADIERAVHAVSPETRLALAQPEFGHDGVEGDFSAAVIQAIAGSNRPLARVHGVSYASDSARDLPNEMFEVMHSCEHLPRTFELLCEGDTYPHTAFFTSATKLRSMIAIALSCGCHDTLFYATQYLDDPLEDSSYLAMYKQHEIQFSAWRHELADSPLRGCEILYRPAAASAVPWKGGMPRSRVPWPGVLGRYGVPYTSRSGAGVKVLSGETAAVLTEAEIQTIFSGGILMDGSAAHILCQRGFDDLLGASAEPGGQASFCYERLRSHTSATTGELIYNFLFAPAGAEAGGFYRLTPHAGCEVLSDFLDPHYTAVQPGLVRFENRLGGRVAIMAFDLQQTQSSAIFCYRKKNALVRLLEWLNRAHLPVTVLRDPNIFLLANQSATGELLLTVINLSADRRSRLGLSIADEWAGSEIHRLSLAGQWEPLDTVWGDRQAELALELSIMQPEYLRLRASQPGR